MPKIAFIFPGQGSQYIGMGKDLAKGWKAAHQIFEQAGDSLGFDMESLCWTGPEDQLNLTEFTQPAILTTSIAALQILKENGIQPAMVAGHSLGEYTGIVAGGALTFPKALKLVQNRGRYMQEAVEAGKGGMSAILGLSRSEVENICKRAQDTGIVSSANINGHKQIVISGEKPAVDRAGILADQAGAKRVIPLPVSVPSHCSLMEPAAKQLASDLKRVNFEELTVPLVANYHAKMITNSHDLKEALERQLESPVLWVDSILEMKSQGIDTFVEVGPGKILSSLVKRIIDGSKLYNVEDRASLDKTLSALGSNPS